MLSIFRFKNIYILPVLAIFIFYIVPSALGVVVGSRSLAMELLVLSMLSSFVYLVCYLFCCRPWFLSLYNAILKVRIGWEAAAWSILTVYFTVIVYAALTVPQIALVAAFKGVTLSELSVMREEFLRTREGWERILLYVYAIGISSLVPLTISQMFLVRSKWRFAVLGVFIVSLALTLEKGRTLVAMLPLIVLFVNLGSRNRAYWIIFCLAATISLVSIVARGALTAGDNVSDPGPMAGVPDEYNLFVGEKSQLYYIINRVWYIPYVTAIDWLRYKQEVLHGESVSGRSISAVAWLLNEDKVNLERDVFAFEWGQNETGTGSANSAYYVDAYLNFGYPGVILYSVLLAFFVRVCVCSKNYALIACLAISVYYVCFHSLTAVLFSGGLGFLFLFALFFKVDFKNKSIKEKIYG